MHGDEWKVWLRHKIKTKRIRIRVTTIVSSTFQDHAMTRSTILSQRLLLGLPYRRFLLFSVCCLFSQLNCLPHACSDEGKQPPRAAPGEIVGVVVDENGNPLAGVKVDAWSWYTGNEVTTDEHGRFRLKAGNGENRVEVQYSKPGYSPHYDPRHDTGGDEFSITLERGTYIEGRVLAPDGKPVPDAIVKGQHGPHQADGVMIGDVTTTTKTDAGGKYRMYVFPEKYEMQVTVPGVGVARIPGIVAARNKPTSLDIPLKPGVRFEAIVVDEANEKPLPNFVLWSWQQPSVMGKSDADGRIVIEGMLPGKFEFSVGYGKPSKIRGTTYYRHGILGRWWSPDATVQWEHRTIENNGWQRNFDNLTFDLHVGMDPVKIFAERGVVFTGKVLDPDGNPVAGATVAPAKSGSGNSLTGDTRYSAKSRADGTYRVVMPAGNAFAYNLMVHDGKYQQWRHWANGVTEPFESVPNQKFVNFDMKLTRPCTVKGKVISVSGGNVKGIKVGSQATDLLVNRYYDPETRTKADGSFELKFIRPGEHTIRAEPFHFRAQDGRPGSWWIVNLKEGETSEGIELQIP